MYRSHGHDAHHHDKENVTTVKRLAVGTGAGGGHAYSSQHGPFKTPSKEMGQRRLAGATTTTGGPRTGVKTNDRLPTTVRAGKTLGQGMGSQYPPRTPFALKVTQTPGTRPNQTTKKSHVASLALESTHDTSLLKGSTPKSALSSASRSARRRQNLPTPTKDLDLVARQLAELQLTKGDGGGDEYDLEPEYAPPRESPVPIALDMDLPTFDPDKLHFTPDKPWDWYELIGAKDQAPSEPDDAWLSSLCMTDAQLAASHQRLVRIMRAKPRPVRPDLLEEIMGKPKNRTKTTERTSIGSNKTRSSLTVQATKATQPARSRLATLSQNSRTPVGTLSAKPAPLDWIGDECLSFPEEEPPEDVFQFEIKRPSTVASPGA